MRTLLNTLYVQTQGSYLRLENDNVRLDVEGSRVAMLPLHHLDGVVVFGNVLISPYLIQRLGPGGTRAGQLSARGPLQPSLEAAED